MSEPVRALRRAPVEVQEPAAGIGPYERIKALQKEIDQLVEAAGVSLRSRMHNLAEECSKAQELPTLPSGDKEEYRQVGVFLKASLERMSATRSRR